MKHCLVMIVLALMLVFSVVEASEINITYNNEPVQGAVEYLDRYGNTIGIDAFNGTITPPSSAYIAIVHFDNVTAVFTIENKTSVEITQLPVVLNIYTVPIAVGITVKSVVVKTNRTFYTELPINITIPQEIKHGDATYRLKEVVTDLSVYGNMVVVDRSGDVVVVYSVERVSLEFPILIVIVVVVGLVAMAVMMARKPVLE